MTNPIQLNVVTTDTPEVFNYLLYPQQDPQLFTYITNQFDHIGSTIMDSGRKLIEDSRQLFTKFYDSSIEQAARAASRLAKNLVHPNTIVRYDTLEEMQSAPPMMQRWIMAEPYIRHKFHQQLCSGFGDSYVDVEPGFLKDKHYDWRRIYDGMVRFEENNEQEEWVSTTYLEDLREGDRHLTFYEKVDIQQTHTLARLYAEAGFDPSCPFGGKIG